MIEEIKESALAMDRLLIQADKLLKNSFEKAKKRITNKKRREAIFLLNDSSGALQNETKRFIPRERGKKPGRKSKLMVQLTSVQRVTVMRSITEVKMKRLRVDPEELQRVRPRKRKKPVRINTAQDIKKYALG